MTGERTALSLRMTELHKARLRLPLLTVVTVLIPSVAGIRSVPAWVLYVLFAVLYALWALRLTAKYCCDRRLGYLLCAMDAAVLLPLLVWESGPGVRSLVVVVYAAGLAMTYVVDKQSVDKRSLRRPFGAHVVHKPASGRFGGPSLPPERALEQALRIRLGLFLDNGTRFALVVLRVLRFEEARAYYGPETAERMLAAVGRRGSRRLGPDGQRFCLSHGRVAFVFEIEASARSTPGTVPEWSDPYDVEGMAMQLARKTCEHLIDGRRVECVVGWASVPADGLSAEDLLFAAESGTRSTEAFRRVSGVRVPARVVPTSGAAVSEEARTAVG